MRAAIAQLTFAFVFLSAGRAVAGAPVGRFLTDAQVKTVTRARIGDLARCYRRERPRLGVPAGRLDLYWQVRDTGKVSIVYTRTDTLGSPELRECVESAITRWVFPRFRAGYVEVSMPFAFAPGRVIFGDAAEEVSAVPDVSGANAMRALLLRFGPRFITFGCVAGTRSFLGRACDSSIARAPRIGVDARYTTDQPTADVGRALIRFEFERIDAIGFALGSWPHPPAGARDESGPLDGFAVWPAGAFKVELTAPGEEAVHDGVKNRCEWQPWSPCKHADRSGPDGGRWQSDREASWPLLEERWAQEVERLIEPTLRHFESERRLRMAQTLSFDIDGDGKPEILHNVAVTNVAMRPAKDHGREWYPDAPTTFFFLFQEKDGHLIRVPVLTRPSGGDGMDGLVLGWVDVDGDGRSEALMETPAYEGLTWQLVRFRDGAFRPVAEFGYTYFGQVNPEAPSLFR